MGLDPDAIETIILAQEVVAPPPRIAKLLPPTSGQTALRIERLRLLDSKPISLQESWIPYLSAPSLAREGLIGGSLYRTLLETAGIEIRSAEQQVTAAPATPRQAELLKVPNGSPLLEIFRVSFTGAGEPVEVAHGFTLPTLPLSMHLER
jgi:GntR family transcriptional regulator